MPLQAEDPVAEEHAHEPEGEHGSRVHRPPLLVFGIDPTNAVRRPLDGQEEAIARCLATPVDLRHVVAEQRRADRAEGEEDDDFDPVRSTHRREDEALVREMKEL